MTVTRKLLIPALLFFALTMAGLIVLNWVDTTARLEQQEADELRRLEQTLAARLESLKSFALALATEVAHNPEVQAAFAAGDRERLTALTLPAYEQLNAEFTVPQYQFHLPPATSFLRLHQLDRYGDDLSSFRFTVLAANAEQQPVSGLEIGRGGLGMRGVVPISYQGQHIGTVEFGLDVDQTLLASLKEQFGVDWQILLSRGPAEIATFQGATSEAAGPTPELLLQATTLSEPVFSDPAAYAQTLAGTTSLTRLKAQDRDFAVLGVPLRDYSGAIIGVVDVVADRTARLQALNSRLLASTLLVLGALAIGGLGLALITTRTLRPIGALTEAASAAAGGDLSRMVIARGRDELARLATAFNTMTAQLREMIGTLERRVTDRTRDLALVAEISQVLSRERDLTTLLMQAVDLIRTRFSLYHTQIYLADPNGQTLVLRASTGEAGRELLHRSHRLSLDLNSLNGTAAATKQTIIIADTRTHPGFRPNALLPDTRSEMAIPLIVGDQVLGVLDLQSERVGGLSAENEYAFNALAGQLASAIEGSQLFTQLEQARVELVAQTRRLTRSGWQEFLDGLRRAERLEQTFVRVEADNPNPSVLKIPLEVSGETVGAATVECETGRAWAPDEVELVQAVARQAAQQMENLRLLAQAEQYRAEAEQAIRRLTLEGWKAFRQDRAELEAGFVYAGEQVQPAGEQAPAEAPMFQHTLAVGDMPIGAVEIAGDVDETVAGLVGAVADRLSRHLETLRLSEQSQQRAQEMELLSRIGQALISQPDLAGLLRVAGDTILSAFGADQGYIALYAAAEDRLEFPYYRVNGEYLTPLPAPLGDGANTTIVRSGQPVLINHAGDRRLAEPGPRAWLGVPILAGQTVIGLISVQSLAREDAFGVADQRLLTTIAASLSTAIQNARLYADTQQRAEREAIINAINQKIQSAVTVHGALQTAVQELGTALKARRASVALTLGEARPVDGDGHPAGNGQAVRVAV